jgi:hypothetical protein
MNNEFSANLSDGTTALLNQKIKFLGECFSRPFFSEVESESEIQNESDLSCEGQTLYGFVVLDLYNTAIFTIQLERPRRSLPLLPFEDFFFGDWSFQVL